jgi:cytochrome b6-f complex iron-sulfur subunit
MAVDEQFLGRPKRVSAKAARAARDGQVAPAPPTTAAPPAAADTETAEQGITRREFLNLAWLASLGIFTLQMGGVAYNFTFPRFRAGEFGGTFSVPITDMPEVAAGPVANNQGKFWLVQTPEGVLAIYKVCTHLGCLYDWKPTENQFICPCHGSTFEKDGKFVRGPAPRNLDRFSVTVRDASGAPVSTTNPTTGGPAALGSNASTIDVNTGLLIQGARHA